MPPTVAPLPVDGAAGGIVPESVGEAVGVAGGVLLVGDAAGEEDVGNGEGDEEADADGEAGEALDEVGEAPDGLGDGDTVADDVGAVAGDGVEQYALGRVGDGLGIRDVQVPLAVLAVGEAARPPMPTVPVTTEPPVLFALPPAHFSLPAVPGDGEEPFPVPLPPWEPCPPPDKPPFPFVVPPPLPFAPPLLFPVSTAEPTCTMASRNGGTARLRHAMTTMPASMTTAGRNWCHDGRRHRASRAAAFSRPAQYPRRT